MNHYRFNIRQSPALERHEAVFSTPSAHRLVGNEIFELADIRVEAEIIAPQSMPFVVAATDLDAVGNSEPSRRPITSSLSTICGTARTTFIVEWMVTRAVRAHGAASIREDKVSVPTG